MKVIRIYHRKELVEEAKRMHRELCFYAKWIDIGYRVKYTYVAMAISDARETARAIRQFRIKYGIYECF